MHTPRLPGSEHAPSHSRTSLPPHTARRPHNPNPSSIPSPAPPPPSTRRPYIFAQSIKALDNNGVGQGARQQGQWQRSAAGAGGGVGGAPRVDRAERRAAEAGLWEALRANPNAWYDNRATKQGRQPDFRHKTDRNQALWVESEWRWGWGAMDGCMAGSRAPGKRHGRWHQFRRCYGWEEH